VEGYLRQTPRPWQGNPEDAGGEALDQPGDLPRFPKSVQLTPLAILVSIRDRLE
jgi:hypothetical protein